MGWIEAAARGIDAVNRRVGRAVAWLALAMVLVQFALVLMRYVFGVGSVMAQEALIYAHALLFLLAAGYTLLSDGHVRVDVFYRPARARTKALIDLVGVLVLLLPFCWLLWDVALPYVEASWRIREGSRETAGLPFVYLLKTAIPAFVLLLALQGLSLALRAITVLAGRAPGHLAAPEA